MKWSEYANLAQLSLEKFYLADTKEQFLNNFYPTENPEEDNKVFNYWWLAHLVEVRLDAYLRTKKQADLEIAENTYLHNKNRNGGTLIHDFYDDMLWNALAAYRLYKETGKPIYLEDAQLVWQDLVDTGWNNIMGGGFAWRRPQMYYKNTPVNAPFIILSCWLYNEFNETKYLEWAMKTYEWQTKVLVREDGFVEDGINRLEDGAIDYEWKFTYNQGVYIGANLELYRITKEAKYLDTANKTADISLKELTEDGIFKDEGNGGDEGLFKGIFYRYFTDLMEETANKTYRNFVFNSCQVLVDNAKLDGYLLMGMNWKEKPSGKIPYSAELSGMIALEMAAKLER
ncbi:glycoside hydrolase [Listeria monocytogenes serotype 1/2b]|nr:glycoside hydrolase [Listeria monocytogenes]EHC6175680.1 glycoside hydrolase [Listeria monocytogenes serotype 1/2b]EAD1240320.1 glycoside hydrolase [Listeria monocytogenes]EAE7096002.1 glycoside hydrolase [Listeria monocytogenes]EAF6810248.1 glycoside hydrolase [Listeria monocytogenes]